jgi:hypothetical protein
MNVVTEKNRLPGTLQVTGVFDDGSLVFLRSRWGLLAVHDRRREGEHQHHDRS